LGIRFGPSGQHPEGRILQVVLAERRFDPQPEPVTIVCPDYRLPGRRKSPLPVGLNQGGRSRGRATFGTGKILSFLRLVRPLSVGQVERPVASGRVPSERTDGISRADLGEGRVHQVLAVPLASEPSLDDGRNRRVPDGDILSVHRPRIPLPRYSLARRAAVRSRMAEEVVQYHVLGMEIGSHREVIRP